MHGKLCCVVPLFKTGNRKKVYNYRPVTQLPVIGKLLEKLIHRRILSFLDDSKFLAPAQGGFRPNLGTETTITTLLTYIYEKINEKSQY